jgi:hypothetical protein
MAIEKTGNAKQPQDHRNPAQKFAETRDQVLQSKVLTEKDAQTLVDLARSDPGGANWWTNLNQDFKDLLTRTQQEGNAGKIITQYLADSGSEVAALKDKFDPAFIKAVVEGTRDGFISGDAETDALKVGAGMTGINLSDGTYDWPVSGGAKSQYRDAFEDLKPVTSLVGQQDLSRLEGMGPEPVRHISTDLLGLFDTLPVNGVSTDDAEEIAAKIEENREYLDPSIYPANMEQEMTATRDKVLSLIDDAISKATDPSAVDILTAARASLQWVGSPEL